MTPQDQLRIEFAERLGWTRIERGAIGNISGKSLLNSEWDYKGTPPEDKGKDEDSQRFLRIPNPTSREDVHNALMGMDKFEWSIFSEKLIRTQHRSTEWTIQRVLQTPLPTIVSCFMAATEGRVKR